MLKKTSIVLTVLLSILITADPIFSQPKRRKSAAGAKARPLQITAPTAPAQLTAEQQKRLESFNTVWQTIKDNYFDQTFNGLNWDNIKKEYEPRVLLAKTSYQFHSVLQEMINRLNRSHFMVIPPEVITALEKAKQDVKRNPAEKKPEDAGREVGDADEDINGIFDDSDSKYGIGVDLRLIKQQLVITEVEPQSPADKAGLKTGFVIDKINNVALKDVYLQMSFSGAYGRMAEKYFPLSVLFDFIDSDTDSVVKIDYLDEKDLPHSIEIRRERLKGKLIKAVANFPKQFFSFESKTLDENTGYVRFNMFAINAVDGMCRALRDLKDKKTLIVDLRGNMGGSIGALIGITSMLVDKPVMLGTQISKNSRDNIVVAPQGRMYSGKLVILVDSMSYSAAEIFAGGLQESGRATVVGEKSAGEALPSTTKFLATGALFIYPFANFQTISGTSIEGVGVQPDVKVLRERKGLLEGKDAQLEAALAFSKGELKKPIAAPPKMDAFDGPPPPRPMPKQRPADAPADTGKKAVPKMVSGGISGGVPGLLSGPSAPPIKIEKRYDEQALKAIAEYVTAIGGAEALKKFSSYSAIGNVEISRSGTKVEGTIQLIGKSPDKSAELLFIEAAGEIRGIFDGKKYYLRSELTGNAELDRPRQITEYALVSDLQELLKVKELYEQVIYVGEYQRRGKPAILVRAVTWDGTEVAFAFDKTSKFLLQRSGSYVNNSYDDYRPVEGIMVPFWQSRSDAMVIKLADFKLNVPVDDSFFVPKDNCFSVQKTINEEKINEKLK